MLKRFSVTGYRSFRETVTLDFGKHHDYGWHNDAQAGDSYINNGIISNALILGANATGKTNLGYALMDIKDNFIRRPMGFGPGGDEGSSFLNGDSERDNAEFEYVFQIDNSEITYLYRKDGHRRLCLEKLLLDGLCLFEWEPESFRFDEPGLARLGADGLNWDFVDDELSLLGYFSNSLPKTKSRLLFLLRRFIDGMGMISVPTRAPRLAMIQSSLRQIVRSRELVTELEHFLQQYGVDEQLRVVDSPDGTPTLFFNHKRLVPFAQACSSGTLTLLLLFSRFFMREGDRRATFLYIDEFDAYLHYEVAEELVSSFGASECQTVCSTHNTSLVRNVTMRPDCVFEITRSEPTESNGGSSLLVKSLADRTNREIRRINNVEHLLRNGEFE